MFKELKRLLRGQPIARLNTYTRAFTRAKANAPVKGKSLHSSELIRYCFHPLPSPHLTTVTWAAKDAATQKILGLSAWKPQSV